jgi:hypothetical protein
MYVRINSHAAVVKLHSILFKNPAIQLPYVAQGSYIGVPVVYITHLTRENIKLSKKYTPFIHKMNIRKLVRTSWLLTGGIVRPFGTLQ